MIFFRYLFLFLFLGLQFCYPSALAETAVPKSEPAPAVAVVNPAAPTLDATAFLLQDFNTGQVLAEHNADSKLAPASLTKIMTVYVAFKEISSGRLRLDDMVTVSKKAWETQGSRMFLDLDTQVKVEDLLKGVIVQSGNDASVALAEQVAGDEAGFAELMNQTAAKLGMNNSHFKNADGLPNPDHYTTARDLAKLTTALIREYPDYYRWFALKEFTYNKITQPNRNKLLERDPTVDGVKTGHTEEAGFCLVSSAVREGMRLIGVVLGTKGINARANESQTLLNYGFGNYESHRLHPGKTALNEAKVWKGDIDKVPVGVAEDLFVTILRNSYKDVKAEMAIDKKLTAPIKEGDKLGVVNVTLAGKTILSRDLIALKPVAQGNVFSRLIGGFMMMMEK